VRLFLTGIIGLTVEIHQQMMWQVRLLLASVMVRCTWVLPGLKIVKVTYEVTLEK
jgi:hypothetical protein